MASWTAPRTWTVGEIVTAALLNTHVRDNELYLKAGDGGVIQFEERVAFDNDASFYAEISSSNPTFLFDTNDYLQFDRSGNALNYVVGGTSYRVGVPQYMVLRRCGGSGSGVVGTTYAEFTGSGAFLFNKAEVPYPTVDVGFEWEMDQRTGGASTVYMELYDVTNTTQIVEDSTATEDQVVWSPFVTITASGQIEYTMRAKTDNATGSYNVKEVRVLLRTKS